MSSPLDFLASGTRTKFASAFSDVNVSFGGSSPSPSFPAPSSSFPTLLSRVSTSAADAATGSSEEMEGVDLLSAAPVPVAEPEPTPGSFASPPTHLWFPPAPPLQPFHHQGKAIISESMHVQWMEDPRHHHVLQGVSLPPSPAAPAAHHRMWAWCQLNTGPLINLPRCPPLRAPGFRVRMTVDVHFGSLQEAVDVRNMAARREAVWLEFR